MSKRKHRFFNTYLTATISVSLVLLLIGLECAIGLSATWQMNRMKESTVLTVVLSDATTSSDSLRLTRLLDRAPFCREVKYISKEVALADHITDLGEDPTEFLGYNPIRAAFEVNLMADYVEQDSLAAVETMLKRFEFVEDITYPRVIVTFFSKNVGRISLAMLGVAAILLLISIVLIINTIRLTVYSRRFLINTMKLVGATPWMIKGPIVARSMWMGLAAAVLAVLMLSGVIYLVFYTFGVLLFPLTWQNILFVSGTTLIAGLLLTFFASMFAVNKYIRLRTDDLYFV